MTDTLFTAAATVAAGRSHAPLLEALGEVSVHLGYRSISLVIPGGWGESQSSTPSMGIGSDSTGCLRCRCIPTCRVATHVLETSGARVLLERMDEANHRTPKAAADTQFWVRNLDLVAVLIQQGRELRFAASCGEAALEQLGVAAFFVDNDGVGIPLTQAAHFFASTHPGVPPTPIDYRALVVRNTEPQLGRGLAQDDAAFGW